MVKFDRFRFECSKRKIPGNYCFDEKGSITGKRHSVNVLASILADFKFDLTIDIDENNSSCVSQSVKLLTIYSTGSELENFSDAFEIETANMTVSEKGRTID